MTLLEELKINDLGMGWMFNAPIPDTELTAKVSEFDALLSEETENF